MEYHKGFIFILFAMSVEETFWDKSDGWNEDLEPSEAW